MLMSDRQLAGSVSAEPPWPPPWRVSRGWLPDVYFLKSALVETWFKNKNINKKR